MELKRRFFLQDEQPIDPIKAVIPDIEILVNAATGITGQQHSVTESPLVTPEEHKAEDPYSR